MVNIEESIARSLLARFFRWRFSLLLLALLSVMLVHPLVQQETNLTLGLAAISTAVMVSVLITLFQSKRARIIAALLGIPSLIVLFAGRFVIVNTHGALIVTLHAFPIAFLSLTVVVILARTFTEGSVTVDRINGAFCGYLMIGLTFGHLYCLAEWAQPGSISIHERLGAFPGDLHHRFSMLCYFSLVTLTTVGFGDIAPISPGARTLAWMEAVIGQFYVAVVVAQLVALNVASAISRRGSEDRPSGARD